MEAGPSSSAASNGPTQQQPSTQPSSSTGRGPAPLQSAATLAAFSNAAFTTSGALMDMVDRKVLLVLRDNRTLIGILRSYDQFANLVLQKSVERFYSGKYWAEAPRGIYVVRGENVLMMGEIDLAQEDDLPAWMERSSVEHVAQLKRDEEEQQKTSSLFKADLLMQERGFSLDHAEGDAFHMT